MSAYPSLSARPQHISTHEHFDFIFLSAVCGWFYAAIIKHLSIQNWTLF
jgi:hypothetical protein